MPPFLNPELTRRTFGLGLALVPVAIGEALKANATPRLLDGYVDRQATTAAYRRVNVHVRSTVGRFRIRAWRTGWYRGAGKHLIWESGFLTARSQPAARIDPATRMVSCRWSASATLNTTSWPEGLYTLELVAAGLSHRIPLVVESASMKGRPVIVFNDLTMQAYNHWGNYSLYTGPGRNSATRSLKVSFDRPYDNPEEIELGNAPLVRIADSIAGLRPAYTTESRLASHPGLLAGARALLFSGHSEYWSQSMRSAIEAARDAGTNLVFFGANNSYWRVRCESANSDTFRTLVCYRDPALDPLARRDPRNATTRWRDGPYAQPECSVTGAMYADMQASGTFTVTDPAFFAFAGTGARKGATYAGLVGGEVDRVGNNRATPSPIHVFAHSPTRGYYNKAGFADSCIYTVKSGAGVINLSSMYWLRALEDTRVPAASRAFGRKMTANIIQEAAIGPLGKLHRLPATTADKAAPLAVIPSIPAAAPDKG